MSGTRLRWLQGSCHSEAMIGVFQTEILEISYFEDRSRTYIFLKSTEGVPCFYPFPQISLLISWRQWGNGCTNYIFLQISPTIWHFILKTNFLYNCSPKLPFSEVIMPVFYPSSIRYYSLYFRIVQCRVKDMLTFSSPTFRPLRPLQLISSILSRVLSPINLPNSL